MGVLVWWGFPFTQTRTPPSYSSSPYSLNCIKIAKCTTLKPCSNRRPWGWQVTGLLPMQVNGAFHGIEKTRVMKAYNQWRRQGVACCSYSNTKIWLSNTKATPSWVTQCYNVLNSRFGLILFMFEYDDIASTSCSRQCQHRHSRDCKRV